MLDKATWQEATEITGRVGVDLSIVGRDSEKFERGLDYEIPRMREDMIAAYKDWLVATEVSSQ